MTFRPRHEARAQDRSPAKRMGPMDLNDAQTGMPPSREAQCAFKDSMIHKFCDSHYISRFAAFFIDARAKRSFVESFKSFLFQSDITSLTHKGGAAPRAAPKHGIRSTGLRG
jgi:hypothetical protein